MTEAAETNNHDVQVVNDVPARRWEIYVDGVLAGLLDYRESGDRVDFIHAETYPRFEHMGFASTLTRRALDAAIAEGKAIVASCPFVVDFIASNPSYAEFVAAD